MGVFAAVVVFAFAAAASAAEKSPAGSKPDSPQRVSPARPDIKPPFAVQECCAQQCCAVECRPMRMKKLMMHKPMPGGRAHMIKKMRTLHPGHFGGGVLEYAEELGLSKKQKDQIEDIMHGTRVAIIDLKADAAKAKLELKKLIHDDASLNSIRTQLEALKKAEIEIKLAQLSIMKKANKILTDDQKKKLQSLRDRKLVVRCETDGTVDIEDMEMIMEDSSPVINRFIKEIEISDDDDDLEI